MAHCTTSIIEDGEAADMHSPDKWKLALSSLTSQALASVLCSCAWAVSDGHDAMVLGGTKQNLDHDVSQSLSFLDTPCV